MVECFGPNDSFCLVDSSWNFGAEEHGILNVRFTVGDIAEQRFQGDNSDRLVLRAFVESVSTANGAEMNRWNVPVPHYLSKATAVIKVPWVRLKEQFLPAQNLVKQIQELEKLYPTLKHGQSKKISSRVSMRLIAVIYPTELAFGKDEAGWTLLCVLTRNLRKKKRQKSARSENSKLEFMPIRIFRAGWEDIGYRVPAFNVLRNCRILLVGLGALGAPIAIELARNGCRDLILMDHDTLEPGNTVRWPLGVTAWGKSKSEALESFICCEYPTTSVQSYKLFLGQPPPDEKTSSDEDAVISEVIQNVDLIIDASASYGVTSMLYERCKDARLPLISLFATPTLQGGVVTLHAVGGGCPNCLEYAWESDQITPPLGREDENNLLQPPGCSERTFTGAAYDLQELSLQTVRVVVGYLKSKPSISSTVYTLRFVNQNGESRLPTWESISLPKHSSCPCNSNS